jgi:RIO kinase 1
MLVDEGIIARGERLQNELEGTVYSSTGMGLTRDTRATVDSVFDPKTVAIVNKLIKQGYFDEIAGCISTGKEANVYFGIRGGEADVAVKIYKTSILGFRDRDEYVDGEFRFRHGYCKSNPRKMVSLWAEKEQRNLNRIRRAGIACPEVLACKRNVLVMSLAGRNGRAAPRLKDVTQGVDWGNIYQQVLLCIRNMFIDCKLVHGDMSEYNLLLDGDLVVVIDVSQSVGIDHPRSLEFLKRDCLNLNNFFSKKILSGVMPLQKVFRFVTGEIRDSGPDALIKLMEHPSDSDTDQLISDSEFIQTWLPSSLSDLVDIRDVERLISSKAAGMSTVFDDFLAATTESENSLSRSEDEISDSGSNSGDSFYDGNEAPEIRLLGGHIPPGMSKQEWKKIVKEERRELRRNKVPKHIKNKRNLKKYGKK